LSNGNAFTYSYDQYGNRWKQIATAGGGPQPQYSFNSHNQIVGDTYDAAGNLTSDGICTPTPCWTYDDRGNLIQGEGATFAYDGLGRRVQKISGGVTYDFFLNLDGTPWDEYQGASHSRVNGGLFTYANNTTYFNRTDHLGTPRVTTDYTATIVRTESNLPFGDGFTKTTSPFLDFVGYAGGFWDSESNADHFGAREYGKTQGRWLTPDPAGIGAVDPRNPQTWNRYAYVNNNPMSHVDPTGKAIELAGAYEARKRQLEALQKAAGKAGSYLYDNLAKDGKHYVGIYKNGPDGKGASFNSINAVSNKLGGIINDKAVATIQFVSPGTKVMNTSIGSADNHMSPAGTFAIPGIAHIYVTSDDLGHVPGTLIEGGKPTEANLSEVLIHELGHVDSVWYHGGEDSDGDAVRIENQVRQAEGAPMRIGHTTPNDVNLSGLVSY
jgi:RHS repeat-associated protein